jgi:hypothetical protein
MTSENAGNERENKIKQPQEQRLFRSVVAQFIGTGEPDESGNYKNNKRSCGSLDPQGEAKASPLRNFEVMTSENAGNERKNKIKQPRTGKEVRPWR